MSHPIVQTMPSAWSVPPSDGTSSQRHDDVTPSRGLYTPSLESDGCGTGFIANLNGIATHQTVEQALEMLTNMEHRGATGYEPNTGDGAGILVQTPHAFFQKKCRERGFELPEYGEYGVGIVFFPQNKVLRNQCRALLTDYADELGFDVLGYRLVPTDHEDLGDAAISVEPRQEQIFVAPRQPWRKQQLERKLYLLRKYATHQVHITMSTVAAEQFYIASFSYKTVLYKGQLTTHQLRPYFPDLQDEMFETAIALVHSRFSTNTEPKWKLAQPFRYIAHNGEINTVVGNINWWKSKESVMRSTVFSDDELKKLFPVCGQALSDSANFDNVLEFLVMNGRSMPHALMMMIPEAWQHDPLMPEHKKAFYEYHETLMEPWDGPAAMCFSDGIVVGAMLDRNGLRPLRYVLTDDNTLICASEVGILDIPQEKIVLKGRLQPGKMLIADLDQNRIIEDEEVKGIVCRNKEYGKWLIENRRVIVPTSVIAPPSPPEGWEFSVTRLLSPPSGGLGGAVTLGKILIEQQQLFGYTKEDLKTILAVMSVTADEPLGSMGTDTPLAVLSQLSQHLSNYFKQLFAQVTNPPIDSIRERAVMSLHVKLGACGNILIPNAEQSHFIALEHPVLSNEMLEMLQQRAITLDATFDADGSKGKLKHAIERICAEAEDAVRAGANLLIISDRAADILNAPIPSLLATGAVHHHLIREGLRANCSIVVEAGDVRETHHFATLIGYGAQAVNPYLAFATLRDLCEKKVLDKTPEAANEYFTKAINKGLLKVMSKIGISTLQSYSGAQIFEILGIGSEVVTRCFTKSISRIEGIGFDGIATETLVRHRLAYPDHPLRAPSLDIGGVYQWKQRGEFHLFNPESIHHLQVAARNNDRKSYDRYAALIDKQNEQACTLRSLLTFRKSTPIALSEVEPVEAIFKRFTTGAMSFGSISHEAHSTLAIAMNRIGARSNSGEGGEDEVRYTPHPNGDSEQSAIKQVASGRFGVTAHYLTMADELQIKVAQGAKPGEGGQLAGSKVDDWIGRVRHATPGVGLISPPPHHDIYSIEDLAQLIFDLKNANPSADINVKLVSKAGVGIIASGVAKAKADKILISGHDGGTGASPLSSTRHAGLPWELGLAETHQTLVRNKLRDRVTLQTDGQIRTGRDLAVAALLGAEEFGVATASLVVEGCVMMRKCHVNTCPVGIATQDPVLRARFTGDAQHVINFFTFLGQHLREIMAELGFRTVDEMIGKVELLKLRKDIPHWKYQSLDLSPILYKEPADENVGQRKGVLQQHHLENVLDQQIISDTALARKSLITFKEKYPIRNTDRAVGTMLSHEIVKQYGAKGLPKAMLQLTFRGSAGQSFAAFAAHGIAFSLEGEANDYFGKGLSGATIAVMPDRKATFVAADNMIIGNVALYGATSGEAYINGQAGERFAVRNSGAHAVVEGVGDHACEYMTGGTVVVLGAIGKNFAAGMSGGIAYVWDAKGDFINYFNPDMADLEDLTDADGVQVRKQIEMHYAQTRSVRAAELLADWTTVQGQFVKVMPREYKAVLAKRVSVATLVLA